MSDVKTKDWPEARIVHPPEVSDALSDFLFGLGAASVVEEEAEGGLVAFRAGFPPPADPDALRESLDAFLARLAGVFELETVPAASWTRVPYGDWAEKWKEDLHPIEVGERLVIRPSWWEYPSDTGRTVLVLDPGLAFGTGRHATTFMCLEELERFSLETGPVDRVLDVGAGSGILALAALALGFPEVTAIDNDPEALPVARENLEANPLPGRIRLVCGEPASLEGEYNLILANLTSGVLTAVAGDLTRLASPGAALILSGILREQAEEVAASYQARGFVLSRRVDREEWTALVMRSG